MCSIHRELKQINEGIEMCSKVIDNFDVDSSTDFLRDCLVNRAEIYIIADELDKAEQDAQNAMNKFQNDQNINALLQKIKKINKSFFKKRLL